MSFKDDAKQWLETDDIPTESEFSQICDKQRWKDELIVLDDLAQEILDILNGPHIAGRPERRIVTGDTIIPMLAEWDLVKVAIKNPSPYDLVFHLNYPVLGPPGDPWREIEVAANSHVDYPISKTFWTDTVVTFTEVTGNDYSGTPIILRITRN